MRLRLLVLLAVLALVAAGCADDTTQPGEAVGTPEATPAATPAAGASVEVASSQFGDIVVDGEGVTVYAFLPDEQGDPTCTDACAQTWPPFEGEADAGEGVDGDLLGAVEHPSGLTQVTYNDWPLYYFTNDAGPGETKGQGVGGNWFVVSPAGEPIQEQGS